MRKRLLQACLCFILCAGSAHAAPEGSWRALLVLRHQNGESLEKLSGELPLLKSMGVNVLVLFVNGHFEFASHPGFGNAENVITHDQARSFAQDCRDNRILLIPHYQAKHMVLFADQHPDVLAGKKPSRQQTFDLLDELIDAFQAPAIHVGLDEIFVMGGDYDPEVHGPDPATPFLETVLALHEHLVDRRGVGMLMWADRLIDGKQFDYNGHYQADYVGLAKTLDAIPRDIILCPWHYFYRKEYPSVPMLIDAGFRVLPSSHAKIVKRDESGRRHYDRAKNASAPLAMIRDTYRIDSPKMLGHFFTTWSVQPDELTEYEPLVNGLHLINQLDAPAQPAD